MDATMIACALLDLLEGLEEFREARKHGPDFESYRFAAIRVKEDWENVLKESNIPELRRRGN